MPVLRKPIVPAELLKAVTSMRELKRRILPRDRQDGGEEEPRHCPHDRVRMGQQA